jgi:hypothetical protein
MKFVLIILVLVYSSKIFACTCVERSSVRTLSEQAENVFVGKLRSFKTAIEEDVRYSVYSVEVVEALKGEVVGEYFVKDMELLTMTSCYPSDISIGDKYIFFANSNVKLSLMHCGSSRNYNWIEQNTPNWREVIGR